MSLDPKIIELARQGGKYAPEAFELVLEALGHTVQLARRGKLSVADQGPRDPSGGSAYHISGRELVEGFRKHALARYGRMALLLLERWGLHRTEDIGEVVFAMVEAGILSRRECDSRADFANGYDFTSAFGGQDGGD